MTWWIWLAFGLVLAATEVMTQTFVLIWFGIAAVIVGIVLWLLPSLGLETQLAGFAVLSLLLLVPAWTVRARVRQHRHKSGPELINDRAAQHLGRTLVLAEPIAHGRGRAFIGDTLWQLSGPDLAAGSAVRVVGADGMTLKVEAAAAA